MLHGTQGHARSFCFMVLLFKDFLVDQVPSTYYLLDIFVSLEAYIIVFFHRILFIAQDLFIQFLMVICIFLLMKFGWSWKTLLNSTDIFRVNFIYFSLQKNYDVCIVFHIRWCWKNIFHWHSLAVRKTLKGFKVFSFRMKVCLLFYKSRLFKF